MSASLSRYLKDFSAPKIEIGLMPPKYFPDLDDDAPAAGTFAMSQQPKIDLELERRDAFQEGRRAAEAELNARHAEAIEAVEAQHRAELEAMRTRCENEIAAMIYDRFCDMGSQLATMISDQAAQVLQPLISEHLVDKAIHVLAQTITQSIEAGEGCKILVKGPGALFEALKAQLSDETLIFRHVESDDIDLTVEFADSILVTRLAAWSDTLRKTLA